jgi:hypothetical protein
MIYKSLDEMINKLREELSIPSHVVTPTKFLCNDLCVSDDPQGKIKYSGQCVQIDLITYRIDLNSSMNTTSYRFYEVVAHEMRHVWQFYNQVLDIKTDRTFLWEQKRHYFRNYPYQTRPYEIDAKKYGLLWAYNNHPRYENKVRI